MPHQPSTHHGVVTILRKFDLTISSFDAGGDIVARFADQPDQNFHWDSLANQPVRFRLAVGSDGVVRAVDVLPMG